VQGDSPARSRDGDLRESAAQAASRLSRQLGLASHARRNHSKAQKCDRKSG
jgi:hypothetical protein